MLETTLKVFMALDKEKKTQESRREQLRADQESLHENQKRFLDFTESASDWFWETGPDHRFTALFGPALERSRFEAEKYIGKLRTDGIDVSLEPEKWQAHSDDIENLRPFQNLTFKRTADDGRERWTKISGRPFFADDGVFKGYRGTGTDVSEQIKAQQQANRSSSLLVDAVESIPEGFLLFDENDRMVICNQNYRSAHGFLGELLEPGTSFYDFARAVAVSGRIPLSQPNPEKWLQDRIKLHQNPGAPFILDYEDGTSTLISEFRTHEGGTAIIRSDITEQRQIENALNISEERFRDFAEAASDWFWETDENHRFTFMSVQYGERIGVPVKHLIGKSIQQIPPQNIDSDIWTALVTDMLAHEEFRDVNQPRVLPTGEVIWLSISGKPVFDNTGQFKGYRGTAIEITQRVLVEKELRESEQRFKDFSNVASDWFWETDAEDRFSYFSDQLELITGLHPAQYLGKTREETKPSGINDGSWAKFLEKIAGHNDFRNVTWSRLRPDGAEVWISVSGMPRFDEGGTFAGYRGTGTDITNEVKASNEINRTQELLFNAVEVMEDGFVLFDAEDRLVLSNQKYKEVYFEIADVLKPGVTFKEIIEAAAERFQIFDSLEDKEAWLKERLEQHNNPTGPFDQKLTRGSWVRVIERKTAEGGIVGLRIDVTKEKQEEQEFRKLSHALEQSPSIIFITDVEDRIEYVNPMFTKICGYTADEVIGKNPRILESGETPAEVYTDLWEAIESGHEWRGELRDRRKDGSRFWAYATISPVKNNDGEITHFVSMHEDITQRKEIESRELRAKEQAEMANRAKSELLANMSHELRTPLNAIIGFSQTLQMQLFGPLGHEKYDEYATDIVNSGEHLLKLINDILDVSAIEAGKLEFQEEELQIGGIVDVALLMVKNRSEESRINLIRDIEDDQAIIHADKRRLIQILLNLLSNAIKFTPSDGEVSLTTALDSNGGHVFTVTDTGVGMNPDELVKAMTEFGQVDSGLDRKHDGAGLGLPLTKGLVGLHGGIFEIDSEKGVGTTVTIRFPASRTFVV